MKHGETNKFLQTPDQLSLVFDSISNSRVSTNNDGTSTDRAFRGVIQSRKSGPRFLLAGFSSLGFILSLASLLEDSGEHGDIRILLGSEELQEARVRIGKDDYQILKEEMREYWLKRRLSILQLPEVITLIRLIKSDRVGFRLLPRFHGKLYVGPESALVGSSNLSHSGMRFNIEVNLRQDSGETDYDDLAATAERLWERGRSAKQYILDLLNELIRVVGYREVLARSAAVVLEAAWISDWEELVGAAREAKLWHSQRQTVAQALFILENNDCVLIADPTGSGKTRAITALHAALSIRQWHTDQPAGLRAAVICPPGVIRNWKSDFGRYRYFDPPAILSSGILSRHGVSVNKDDDDTNPGGRSEAVRRAIEYSTILYLDEAHNLYNEGSNRTRAVRSARAMQRVLATATPIGRSIRDLRPLLELLDLNNLSPELRDVFKQMNKLRYQDLSEDQRKTVTKAISNITVRHTIPNLNEMIDREPDQYTDDLGQRCRYPDIDHRIFLLNETPRDREIARSIRELAGELKGLTGIPREKMFSSRSFWFLEGKAPHDPVKMRLNALAGLARYKITSALRSSVPRLVELIEGRPTACREFGIDVGDSPSQSITGETDTLNRLHGIRKYGLTPVPEEVRGDVPTWLLEREEFARVVDREIEISREIVALGRQLSSARDSGRVAEIRRLNEEFEKVLVFEDSIVTLAHIEKMLIGEELPVINLFAGERRVDRAEKYFGLESRHGSAVGMCSSALSEGVNLQGAQAMLFVQIPIVYRHAEQRIGRIVRMNSSFRTVCLSWPKDAREFTVSTDQRLFKTANDIKATIGHNMDPPESLTERDTSIDAEYVISLVKESLGVLDPEIAIKDAFEPIRSLIYGDRSLVPAEIYESIKSTDVDVAGALRMARVGAVESRSPFVFATIVREDRAPRFFLWTQVDDKVFSRDLELLFERLRELVARGTDQRSRLMQSYGLITTAFGRFRDERRIYVSNRERLALDVFQEYARLIRSRREWKSSLSNRYRDYIEALDDIINTGRWNDRDVDYKAVAGGLIEHVFEPARRRLVAGSSRKKHRTYEDVLPGMKDEAISDESLTAIEQSLRHEAPMETRAVALLVGVGKGGN